MRQRYVIQAMAVCTLAGGVFAQPANDDCANAIMITQNDTVMGMNELATTDFTETQFPCTSTGRDVWYRMMATQSGVQEFSLCNSDFDTVLGVYTGTCGALTLFGCNDTDFFGCIGPNQASPQSYARFEVSAGTEYYIRVAGDGNDPNADFGTYELSTFLFPAVPNDTCATAQEVFEDDSFTVSNDGALSEDPPSTHQCLNGSARTLWYEFTPTVTKRYQVSTCGSTTNTNAIIYEGTCGALVEVANDCQNDQFCEPAVLSTGRAAPDAVLNAGTTYYIIVGTEDNEINDVRTGDINFSLTEWVPPTGACCLPAFAGCSNVTEDDCTILEGSYFGDFTVCDVNGSFCEQENNTCDGATEVFLDTPIFGYDPIGNVATGDSRCDIDNSNGSNDSYFRFTPATTGVYTVSTCGSVWSSLALSVYEDCADIQTMEIACSSIDVNGTCFDLENPVVNVAMTGGEEYIIRLAGHQNNGISAFIADLEVTEYVAPEADCCLPDMSVVTATDADCAAQGGKWLGFGGGSCSDIPDNNSCEGAEMLVVDGAPVAGDLGNLTVLGECQGNPEDGDSYYVFDGLANHTYLFNVNGLVIDAGGMGACCPDNSTANCFITTKADCESLPGTPRYYGDGSECVSCFSDPGATVFVRMSAYDGCGPTRTEIACGGNETEIMPTVDGPVVVRISPSGSQTFFAVDVDLIAIPTGACCSNLGCAEITEADCVADGGSYQGDFVACATSPYDSGPVEEFIVNSAFGACMPTPTPTITIADDVTINTIQVQIDMNTSFGGELDIRVTGPGGQSVILMEKSLSPDCLCGFPTAPGTMDGTYKFLDNVSLPTINEYIDQNWDRLSLNIDIPVGSYRPAGCADAFQSLNNTFAGTSTMGDWTLELTDEGQGFGPGFSQFLGWRILVNGGVATCGTCPCDLDSSGATDVVDLLAFLALWFDGLPGSDYNGDGSFDVADLLKFLACWFPASVGDC